MAGKGGSKVHEKHQLILANMLREEENKYCADCHAKGPRWASWNLGVFMCIRCAGIHRNLGVHISRVKSVNLDSWTPEQISAIQNGGNGKAKEKYEANLPSNFRRPQDDYAVEQFIRSKYERKLYVSKEAPAVSTATQSRSSPAPSGKGRSEKKKHTKQPSPATADKKEEQLLSVPRPPTQSKRSLTPPTSASSAPPNLISMETSSTPSPRKPQQVDLLTDMGSTSQEASPQQPSLGEDPQKAVKKNILSLYQSQPSQGYQSFTAHGYQVNPYHYQQQQMAAMRMAQQQQMTQQQVREVEEKMRQLKMQQGPGQQQSLVPNGQPFFQQAPPTGHALLPQSGGHTLDPHLW